MDDYKTLKDFKGKDLYFVIRYKNKYYVVPKGTTGEAMWSVDIKNGKVEFVDPIAYIDVFIDDGLTRDEFPEPTPEVKEEFKQFLLSFS